MEQETTGWAERLQLVQQKLRHVPSASFWKAVASHLESDAQHPIREEFEQTLGAWVAGALPLADARQSVHTLIARLAETELTLLEEYGLRAEDPQLETLQDLFVDLLQTDDLLRSAERAEQRSRHAQWMSSRSPDSRSTEPPGGRSP